MALEEELELIRSTSVSQKASAVDGKIGSELCGRRWTRSAGHGTRARAPSHSVEQNGRPSFRQNLLLLFLLLVQNSSPVSANRLARAASVVPILAVGDQPSCFLDFQSRWFHNNYSPRLNLFRTATRVFSKV